MKKRNLLFISLIFLISISKLHSQEKLDGQLLYDRMQNAFALGLQNEALYMGLDLITLPDYIEFRERTIFLLGNYFLNQAFIIDEKGSVKASLYYFRLYQRDYPTGLFIEEVNQFVNYIQDAFSKYMFDLEFDDYFRAKANVVNSIINNSTLFIEINSLPPYGFFFDSKFNQSAEYIANKYYEEIIVNFPEFEIFAYERKINLALSQIYDRAIISSDVMVIDPKLYRKDFNKKEYLMYRGIALQHFNYLCEKYPSHPITLDLNLVFAKVFMDRQKGLIIKEVLDYLQFVLENDPNKNGFRYFLTKEFVSNNEFEE